MQKLPLDIIRDVVSGNKEAKEKLHKAFAEVSPIYKLLELKLVDISKGFAKIEFPYKRDFSRVGGILHGGIIMTVIDQVGGLAALTVNKGVNQVTMELKVNFLKPLSKETQPFIAIGEVVRTGRTTIVCQGKVFNAKNELCAVGLGTWYVFLQ